MTPPTPPPKKTNPKTHVKNPTGAALSRPAQKRKLSLLSLPSQREQTRSPPPFPEPPARPGPAPPAAALRPGTAGGSAALSLCAAQLPCMSARRGAPCPQPGGTWKPWSLTPVFLAPIQLVTWSACASQEVLLQPSI